MKKSLYLEAFSGISGNMFLGALFDLGLDFATWREEMNKLPLPEGLILHYEQKERSSVFGSFFEVYDEHHHPHIHTGPGTHEEHHHSHGHHHPHEHHHYGEIVSMLRDLPLAEAVLEDATAVFTHLAQAEGAVHHRPWQEVGFHEVGNWDSIVDIVGVCLGLKMLGIDKVYVSDLSDGQGFISCAHGLMPVPVPAVVKLLEGSAFRVRTLEVQTELVTPTGMALLKHFAEPVSMRPAATIAKVGYGFGSRETGALNALRAYLLEEETIDEEEQSSDEVMEVAFMVDDASPETLAFFQEKLRQLPVIDLICWPVLGKKQRLGTRFELLVQAKDMDIVTRLIFQEQGTVGFRYRLQKRRVMQRYFEDFDVEGETVRVKHFSYEDIHKYTYEYEDVARLANHLDVSFREALLLCDTAREGG